jgi:hypothetical protein
MGRWVAFSPWEITERHKASRPAGRISVADYYVAFDILRRANILRKCQEERPRGKGKNFIYHRFTKKGLHVLRAMVRPEKRK